MPRKTATPTPLGNHIIRRRKGRGWSTADLARELRNRGWSVAQ